MLSGFIPVTLGNLSSLHSLSIGSNNFSGEISNLTFSKLSSLDELYLSNSNIVFRFDLDWVPPFRLHALSFVNTNQGPNFSAWIYTQKSLQDLYLSSSGISLVDRNKFSSLIESVSDELNLSNNSIAEDISNLTLNCFFLRLDHNNFKGGLPNISSMALIVDLSYNSFSGSIPHSEVLGHLSDWKQLQFMNLGENEFSGTIPINMPQYLEVVILRANQFEGTIPPQLFNLSYLFHLNLAHNKLSDLYVDALPSDTTIELFQKGQDYMYEVRPDRRTIDLSVNSLSGKVSMELFRLVQVQTLNLSHNHFTGTIPKTIGGMKNMESLDLSNNKFCGEIPRSMSHLNFLGYLNLSCNNFNGTIPNGDSTSKF
ncbi:putative leucine-rich repeat domain, L domain-containing protein [Medicago truncatula]|uniref:Putative leucine-rich repeat domain, L domain-containing protein n=1 Tax=Medicago truncatula TaxID=3880 RepID=A0A396JFH6_MEDTR|nr:putative leucine-rich repeat domain, L domain-containing protein [Medicago truncatula]